MKLNRPFTIISALVILIILISATGCDDFAEPSPSADSATETPTPETQATMDAALTQTVVAEEEFQGAVDEAVEAAVAEAVEATMSAMSAVDEDAYGDMSEEEMADEIDKAVSNAEDASEQASTAADDAASDGTLTQEEMDEIEALISDLAYALALAEDLMYLYDDIYGELATETLYLLLEMEDDLDELAAFATDMVELLIMAEEALDGGLAVAEEVVAQFEQVAAQVDTAGLIEARDAWLDARQTEAENRAEMITNMAPSEIAGTRREALLDAFTYVDAARAALADGKLTLPELQNVGQLGANAQAGFAQFSGPLLQNRSAEISGISSMLALGQLPQAVNGVNQLEGLLGNRP